MAHIRTMTIEDYDSVMELLQITPGVCIRDADSRDATRRYLERNPGMSFVAEEQSQIVGCVMSGHDGRRGYLQHLVVLPEFRKRGIGSALVSHCLEKLDSLGIEKTHLNVLVTNEDAARYWAKQGWKKRDDIYRFSFNRSQNPNA